MADDSFILLNLKEDKAKKMAQVISNETCRKILEFLATKEDATETEISNELNIPLSTVHYNMKHLKEAKLVKVEEFHYSEKGKAVDHYKLSNKFVIIAPEASKIEGIKEKLTKILPVALVSLVGAGLIHLFTKMKGRVFGASKMMSEQSFVAGIAEETAVMAAAPRAVETVAEHNIALWFLFGAFVAAAIYLLIDYIMQKKSH